MAITISRAFSSSLLRAIIAFNHLPFFKIFSNFVNFCPNFQIFCPFLSFFNIFCPFSEKLHVFLYFLEYALVSKYVSISQQYMRNVPMNCCFWLVGIQILFRMKTFFKLVSAIFHFFIKW